MWVTGEAEYQAAALQYVRKVSGFRAPSAKNEAVFDHAVDQIAQATAELMANLELPTQRSSGVLPESRVATTVNVRCLQRQVSGV